MWIGKQWETVEGRRRSEVITNEVREAERGAELSGDV